MVVIIEHREKTFVDFIEEYMQDWWREVRAAYPEFCREIEEIERELVGAVKIMMNIYQKVLKSHLFYARETVRLYGWEEGIKRAAEMRKSRPLLLRWDVLEKIEQRKPISLAFYVGMVLADLHFLEVFGKQGDADGRGCAERDEKGLEGC